MSTITAQILIGSPHPYHEGIIPTHYIFLSENDRPALILVNENISGDKKNSNRKVWIPTLENTFKDVLLMIGFYVIKDKNVKANFSKFFKGKIPKYIELYKYIKKDNLQYLYRINKIAIKKITNIKIIISVFDTSLLKKELDVKDYKGIVYILN